MSNMDDDGEDKDDSKRRTRNLSEKKRRDQFNMLVNELSSMVSTNSRKMDKSTVLKSTISFLKNHNEITVRSRAHDVQENWKPAFLSNEEFTYLVLEALEGFVMVFSATGIIYYVSESITSLLGHNPADVVNRSIFDLIHEEDRSNLYYILQENANEADQCQQQIHVAKMVNDNNMIRFQIHIRRAALGFGEDSTYELVQFYGHFKSNMEQSDTDHDMIGNQQEHRARMMFICTGRLCTPQLIRDVSLVDPSRNEFTSGHSLEWNFLFLDHRAPPIIGYLPFEVLGTSVYDYYHFDDLEKVVSCHEALMQKGELTSCYYRFLTKGQQWIWLQSRFYITYHQWNSKPEFVVCTHRIVSYTDIVKGTKEEAGDTDAASEAEGVREAMKDQPSDETMVAMSPSYMSEASEAFASSYQPATRPPSVKSLSVSSTAGTVCTMSTSAPVEPGWSRASRSRCDVDNNSVEMSNDSRSTQRTVSMEQTQKNAVSSMVPQHSIGAQFLDPAPFVGAVSLPAGVLSLPLPTLPIIVSSDQAQLQLQRKHEELQDMIVRQQEELRQVKEQLRLARLGILQPVNGPQQYANAEEVQPRALVAQPRIVYAEPVEPPRPNAQYPQPSPHPPGSHPRMPQ